MPLEDLIKFRVVASKRILRAAKMEAKRFSYTLFVSLKNSASVWVVVVVVVVVDGFTTAYKRTFVT